MLRYYAILLKKILSSGSEYVKKHACLEANYTVRSIGLRVIRVANAYNGLNTVELELELACEHVAYLNVGMSMHRADSTGLEVYLYCHHIGVLCEYLSRYTAAEHGHFNVFSENYHKKSPKKSFTILILPYFACIFNTLEEKI